MKTHPERRTGFLALAVVSFALLALLQQSAWRTFVFGEKAGQRSLLRLNFHYPSSPAGPCRKPTPEELSRLPEHIAKGLEATGICPREKRGVVLTLEVNGKRELDKRYGPRGIFRDWAPSAFEEVPLPPGDHEVLLKLREEGGGRETTLRTRLRFPPGEVRVVSFEPEKGWEVLH